MEANLVGRTLAWVPWSPLPWACPKLPHSLSHLYLAFPTLCPRIPKGQDRVRAGQVCPGQEGAFWSCSEGCLGVVGPQGQELGALS